MKERKKAKKSNSYVFNRTKRNILDTTKKNHIDKKGSLLIKEEIYQHKINLLISQRLTVLVLAIKIIYSET